MKIIEIGHNHMGSVKEGKKLVYEASKSTCDAITVQVREESFYEEYSNFSLPYYFYSDTVSLLKKTNKKFGVALSDLTMLEFFENLKPDFYKILSKDLEDHEFLNKLSKNTNRKLFLSTGMSNYEKINEAIDILGNDTTLIHTSISDHLEDVNLKAINTMKNNFCNNVAYGNHCKNINAIYAAISFEPSDIFLYLKDDKQFEYPDNGHAIPICDLNDTLENINQIERIIGNGIKNKVTSGIKGQK